LPAREFVREAVERLGAQAHLKGKLLDPVFQLAAAGDAAIDERLAEGIDISPSMIRITIASVHRLKPVTRPMTSPRPLAKQCHADPDGQRHPRAIGRVAVDIAPEHVGAKPILRGRPAQPADRRQGLRVDGAETRRKNRDQRHQAKQRPADDHGRMAADRGAQATRAMAPLYPVGGSG
jgi:hypothetical protein